MPMCGRLSRSVAILLPLAAGCHGPASIPPPLEARHDAPAARPSVRETLKVARADRR